MLKHDLRVEKFLTSMKKVANIYHKHVSVDSNTDRHGNMRKFEVSMYN